MSGNKMPLRMPLMLVAFQEGRRVQQRGEVDLQNDWNGEVFGKVWGAVWGPYQW